MAEASMQSLSALITVQEFLFFLSSLTHRQVESSARDMQIRTASEAKLVSAGAKTDRPQVMVASNIGLGVGDEGSRLRCR